MICAKSENREVICETDISKNRRNFAPRFKSIFKMNIKCIITAVLALLVSTACNGGAKQENREANSNPYLNQSSAPIRMRRITLAKCQAHSLTFEIII